MKVPVHFETAAAVAVAFDVASVSQMVQCAIKSARAAQPKWAGSLISNRLKILRQARALIAEQADALAKAVNGARERPLTEILTAEVLPLTEACRFLERKAEKILRPAKVGRSGRPFWLGGLQSEINREPHGVVLIIAPGNYPLFLPCVQTLQALAAGNAVLLKPGHAGLPAAKAFAKILRQAGLNEDLFQVLPEAKEAAGLAIQTGVDKVLLTGSATTGEVVLQQCAMMLTPATMELSGCDAVFVRADADLDLVVRALAFGLRLNGSATCIAPRRVLVPRSLATELEGRLAETFQNGRGFEVSSTAQSNLHSSVTSALAEGAHLVAGKITTENRLLGPIICAGVTPAMRLAQEDVFAPVLSLITVADDEEALAFAAQCSYALGATIFSRDESAARALAARVRAGVVIVNDMIVPTADPRLPFGGRGRSGFGVTRGAEGLLEMTLPKVVTFRRGKLRRHFDKPHSADVQLFAAYLEAAHTIGWRNRLSAAKKLVRALWQRSTKPNCL